MRSIEIQARHVFYFVEIVLDRLEIVVDCMNKVLGVNGRLIMISSLLLLVHNSPRIDDLLLRIRSSARRFTECMRLSIKPVSSWLTV